MPSTRSTWRPAWSRGAGVSLQTLMERFVPLGWFVPVTPGTRLVTVGGAIAATSTQEPPRGRQLLLARHVDDPRHADRHPHRHPGLGPRPLLGHGRWDGLTGIVTEATLRMIPVESSYLLVDTERAVDLDDIMAKMQSGDDDYRYSVA